MSTTSQRHALPIRTDRSQTAIRPGLGRQRRAQRPTEEPIATSLMGPANRPPGVPTMGAPGRSLQSLMGGPDAGPSVSVMGAGDAGTGIELFGKCVCEHPVALIEQNIDQAGVLVGDGDVELAVAVQIDERERVAEHAGLRFERGARSG